MMQGVNYWNIMQDNWHHISITDKTGQQFFKTNASPVSTPSELKNLSRHLAQALVNPHAYAFLDIDSAYILLDGVPYNTGRSMNPAELDSLPDDLLA